MDDSESSVNCSFCRFQLCRFSQLIGEKLNPLVPKKGLEPPHPCEYVDLNHARLPIPPLRHNTHQSSSACWARISSLAESGSCVKPEGLPLRHQTLARIWPQRPEKVIP